MKSKIISFLFLAVFLYVFWVGMTLWPTPRPPSTSPLLKDLITVQLERAYFEGQRDALTGDVRIARGPEGWYWIRSPWDDGTKPRLQKLP